MLEFLPIILSILAIIISIFVICKSYKKENEIHNEIKAVIDDLAKIAIEEFPELKEEIIRIKNNQN